MPRYNRLACAAWLCALAALAAPQRDAFLHEAKLSVDANTALRIDGNLSAVTNFTTVTVKFRSPPGGEWQQMKMELQYGDLFRAVIPAEKIKPPAIEYYVEGEDANGDKTPLFMTPAKPVRVSVAGGADETPPAGFEKTKPEQAEPVPVEPPKPVEKKKKVVCKKNKKGKKVCTEVEEEPQPADGGVSPLPASGHPPPKGEGEPVSPPPAAQKTEPPPQKAEPPDAGVSPLPASGHPPSKGEGVASSPPPSEPPRKRSELEEELAAYTAEDTAAQVSRLEEPVARSALMPSVVTFAQMRALGARTVYEVLDYLPGVSVSRDVQGFYRVGVRGLRNDPEVLFLLDGHPLNDFYDGRALANLPIDNLERIELYRGPAAASVGLGNFLAVVNLVTRRDDGLRASASAGLYEAFDGHLNAAKTFGALKVFGDANVLSQFGQRQKIDTDQIAATTLAEGLRNPGDPAGRTLDNRFFVNAGAGVEYRSTGLGTVRASARYLLENRSALVGQFDTVGNGSKLGWQNVLAGVEWSKKVGSLALDASLRFDQQDTDRLFQLTPSNYRVTPQSSDLFPDGLLQRQTVGVRGYHFNFGAGAPIFNGNRLSGGISAELLQLYSYSLGTNYDTDTLTYLGTTLKRPDGLSYAFVQGGGAPARRLQLGAHLEDVWTPISRLTLELGVRLDVVQLVAADSRGAITGSAFAIGAGPRAGVSFTPLESLALKLSYGRAFRAPTVQELTETVPNSNIDQGRAVGFGGLHPSYVDQVEGGFEYAQTIYEARLKLRGVGFFQNFTDPITTVDLTGNLVPYSNRPGGVRVVGAEGEARLEAGGRAAAWLNASWFRAEDLATVSQARLLTDLPQARFNAGFSLPLGPWLVFDVAAKLGAVRANDSRSVLELIRRYQLPAYGIVSAQLRTELLFDHLELSLLGQNVFDLQWFDDVQRPDRISNIPREGFTAFFRVRFVL